MDIISQLKQQEDTHLEEMNLMSEKEVEGLHQGIVTLAKEDMNKLKSYCEQTIPNEYSSLTIVYEVLSKEDTTAFNDFLFEEVKRVVGLAKSGQMRAQDLTVLDTINLDSMHDDDLDTYVKIINLMVESLKPATTSDLNVGLLEALSWMIMSLDEDNLKQEIKAWGAKVQRIANESDLKVKVKGRSILKDLSLNESDIELSFVERMKAIFV